MTAHLTFMKAHAVAIVRLAYILGYLKCHTATQVN
jgi:DNA polymerase III alpha subunit